MSHVTVGSTETKAGSHNLMTLCNSLKWLHFGSLGGLETFYHIHQEEHRSHSSLRRIHRLSCQSSSLHVIDEGATVLYEACYRECNVFYWSVRNCSAKLREPEGNFRQTNAQGNRKSEGEREREVQ